MDFVSKNKSAELEVGEEQKLKLSEKLALVIGAAPGVFNSQMIAAYMLFFYTDFMKISPIFIAGLFLVIRIISAAVVPVFGIIIDKTSTKWGKYKPWIVFLGIPFGIFGWLIFTVPNLSGTARLVYVVITYTTYSILAAISGLPGSAVVPAVTKRIDDRVSIGQLSFIFVILGAFAVSVFAVPLYKGLGGGNDAKGFSLLMLGAAVFTILVAIFQAFKIKERYIVERKNDEKSPSLKQMLSAVFTNKSAIILYVMTFGGALANGVRYGVQIHFFKYFFHNEGLMAIMGVVGIVPSLLGTIVSKFVIKRFGLKGTILLNIIIAIVTCPILLLIPASSTGMIIFIAISVLTTLLGGATAPAQGALMPAVIDYTEWKTGLNINAFVNSFNGFINTIGTAVSGAIAAGALSVIGYVPGAEQSSGTILGLKVIFFAIPVICSLFGVAIIWFDLTEDKQTEISKELAERRKKAEGFEYI
jgi:sugar (glycoside-pentoside-hexuronide) transporter